MSLQAGIKLYRRRSGNDDGIIKTEIKATYKLKKMTITYRLVNLDTNKVYESYKTAEFDYGTVFTADMLEASPDTDGCLFGGWLGETAIQSSEKKSSPI